MNRSKEKSLLIIVIPILLITTMLIVIGVLLQKPVNEKQQGLTDIFDLAIDETIAYVTYKDGKAGILFHHDDKTFDKSILLADISKAIVDIAFSPNGTSLAYVVANKDAQADLQSTVRSFTLATGEDRELFKADTLITDIEFNPQDEDQLFYLKAGTFENYSPIASARPHEFDLYHYHLSEQSHHRYTNIEQYSMGSLQISSTGTSVYVQMVDDAVADTAEEIFETKQRVFMIPLDSPEEMSVVSPPDLAKDIYDFTIVGDSNEMIFQAVSKTGGNGIFEYELFLYKWDTDEEKQLTRLKEHTSKPIMSQQENQVYFIVDKQFAKRNAAYHLYRMDMDGKNIEEVDLAL